MQDIKKSNLGSKKGFFDSNVILLILKRGLILTMPFILAGSLALVLRSIPIPAYAEFLKSEGFGTILDTFLGRIYVCTLDSFPVILTITISYSFAHTFLEESSSVYIVTSSCAYLIFTRSAFNSGESIFNASWSFTAILVTLISCLLLRFFMKKTKEVKFYTQGAGHYFNMAIRFLIPVAATLLIITAASVAFDYFVGGNATNFISKFFTNIFNSIGRNIFSAALYVILNHLLWFLGFHGSNMLFEAITTTFVPGTMINIELLQQGLAPTEIFSYSYFDVFIYMGGSGTCLCLLIALLIASKHVNNRRLAKFAAIPTLFNISEPFILGLPIVFNPILFVPFTLVPLSSLFISSAAMKLGLVPVCAHNVSWTVPPIINGYVSTGSIAGSILQIVCIAVGVLIYIPFIKMSEKRQSKNLAADIAAITNFAMTSEREGHMPVLLAENSPMLGTSKMLVSDLLDAVKNNTIEMFYQPQVDNSGRLFGVEALLRWKHPIGGYLYPPLIIALADEDGFLNKLSDHITEIVCKDIEKMRDLDMPMSVTINVLPKQLEDPDFSTRFKSIISKYDLGKISIGIEFTEQIALCSSANVISNLKILRAMKIPLSMDDFGVGHSSIMYLQNNHFDVVKLDGKLVRNLMDNERSESITRTITELGDTLDFDVVAEYVETEEQRKKLEELGCKIYQGYYYSKAVDINSFIDYASKFKNDEAVTK